VPQVDTGFGLPINSRENEIPEHPLRKLFRRKG
jgi:hypothetical protein